MIKWMMLARNESPWHWEQGCLTLRLHVQPGARNTAWAGLHGPGAFKVRLAAPPVDGRANEALIAFVAQALGLPRRSVQLVRGQTTREKTLVAQGVDPVQWQALLAHITPDPPAAEPR